MEPSSAFITGGSGFVGSAIVRALLDRYSNCNVTILDVAILSDHVKKERDLLRPNISFIQADITDGNAVESALVSVRPQVVIHTASFIPPLKERYRRRQEKIAFEVNAGGTLNVLNASRAAGVQALVYTSSCCVVVDDVSQSHANIDERWPTVERGTATIYAESKAEAEMHVLRANSDGSDDERKPPMLTCSLRPSVIFGEDEYQLIPSLISCITDKFESPFRIGSGLNLWDTVYVGNVADAHVLAIENLLSGNPTAAGEAFFIQNNEPTSFRDFSLQVWKSFNGHIPPFTVPIPQTLAWTSGFMAEIWTWLSGKPATLSRGSVLDACAMRYASGAKARRILGYKPRVDLEEGIKRSCEASAKRLRNGSPVQSEK